MRHSPLGRVPYARKLYVWRAEEMPTGHTSPVQCSRLGERTFFIGSCVSLFIRAPSKIPTRCPQSCAADRGSCLGRALFRVQIACGVEQLLRRVGLDQFLQ
jgi:hypothetical protein